MAAASRKLAAGDLGQRLLISGDEEIAALGNSLNTMAKSLSSQMLELSEGKQRLELIVGAMTEGVMVLDNTGRISLTNQALAGLLGSDRDLIGKTPLEVFRSPEVENAVRGVLSGGSFEVVETVAGSGSATRTLQANVAPVANAAGVVDSVVVVFHDLTNIRLTEKMRRDFVANVSHEFKTPLTSIRGYAETLLGGVQDPETAADFLRIIERNAQHLETLVTDLLMLARLEADLPVSKEPVNVKVLVEEQIATRKSTIAEHGLKVINECETIDIDADRLRLSTAISNLIDNAIYYNRRDGEIRISGALVNGNFKLSIADSGQGIPADALSRIFERFYRVDKARSRESGRTGLGLAIVKHAVESQGGSISVTSRLGSGSTFSIKLPV
jgi:two-component system phosphate regulon sensor histidine kinase PhoR